jgi:hypothetical protein
VQPGHFVRGGIKQLELQQVSEQGMVAEPGPLPVERDHERVRLLQLPQDPPRSGATGQQVRELAVDALQHRCSHQQPLDLLWLAFQNLGQQVLGHRSLAA